MQGVTPSSNTLYDGVPLEPAPSVRQVAPDKHRNQDSSTTDCCVISYSGLNCRARNR